MKCSDCRKRIEFQIVDEGRRVPIGAVEVYRFNWVLCTACHWAWKLKGCPAPVWLSHRWKLVAVAVLGLYALGFYKIARSEVEAAVMVEEKMCTADRGARIYPFHCERWIYKERMFWVGFLADGTVFRIEEMTPMGMILRYSVPFIEQVDV